MFQGRDILLHRQVDDMLLAGEDMQILKQFAEGISKLMMILHQSIIMYWTFHRPKMVLKVHVKEPTSRNYKKHNELSSKKLEPIDPNKVKELESTEGPSIDSEEGKELQKKNGFIS